MRKFAWYAGTCGVPNACRRGVVARCRSARPCRNAERGVLASPEGRPTIGHRRERRCPTERVRHGKTKPAVPATITMPMQPPDHVEPESRGDEPSRVTERRSEVPEFLGSIRVLGLDPRREPPDWIAIEKPAGMHSVHSSRGDGGPSVEAILRVAWLPLAAIEEAGLVHRLDRETSGVMLVAATPEARARLRRAIADGSIRKTYLAAIAARAPLPSSGEFRLWFASRYRRSAKITVRDRGDGEEGVCRWRTRAMLDDRRLLEVELVGPGRAAPDPRGLRASRGSARRRRALRRRRCESPRASTPSGSSSKARRSSRRRRKASAAEAIVRGDSLRQLLDEAAAFFEASATIAANFIGSFCTPPTQPGQQTFTSRFAATMSTGFSPSGLPLIGQVVMG